MGYQMPAARPRAQQTPPSAANSSLSHSGAKAAESRPRRRRRALRMAPQAPPTLPGPGTPFSTRRGPGPDLGTCCPQVSRVCDR